MSVQGERISRLVRKLGLPEDQVVRDLVQSRLLSAVFSQDIATRLAVKGGFAMRIYTQAKRLTKDIDLQADPQVSMGAVARTVREGIKSALASGLMENVSVTEPKQTETVQRWKINGTVSGGASNVHITVEVSRRGMPNEDLLVRREFLPDQASGALPAVVTMFSPSQMLVSKMAALAASNRTAARDVWDLNDLFQIMVEMRVEPPIGLIAQFGEERLAEMQRAIDDKLESMPWAVARDQLISFLPQAIASTFDENSWELMRTRTSVVLGEWISQARASCGGGPS